MVRQFWKRCVALGTDFVEKYRADPFFHTEINVVTLQVIFGLLILLIVSLSFYALYQDVLGVLETGIEESMQGVPPTSLSERIAHELNTLRTNKITLIVLCIVLITILFGYVLARITLSPVRNALESQKQFIGNVAHELRTPLSTVKTNTEVALFDTSLPSPLRETLESNVEELDRIASIINNLLSLSASLRPERIEFSNVDVGEVVQLATKKLQRLVDRKQLELTMKMSEWRTVWGNAAALEQIVSNILKNSISFTPSRGHIAITVQPVGQHTIELVVQDSGSGISRSDLFRIFEPFYRADRSRNRARGGSGLGLTIVSELVKLHGGKITVRSIEGTGTTVTLLFPIGTATNVGVAFREPRADEITIDFSHNNGGKT